MSLHNAPRPHGHQPGDLQDLLQRRSLGDMSLADAIKSIVLYLKQIAERSSPQESMDIRSIVQYNSGVALPQGNSINMVIDDRFNGLIMSVYQGSMGVKLFGGAPPKQGQVTGITFERSDFYAVPSTGPVYVPLASTRQAQVTIYSDPNGTGPLIGSVAFVRF